MNLIQKRLISHVSCCQSPFSNKPAEEQDAIDYCILILLLSYLPGAVYLFQNNQVYLDFSAVSSVFNNLFNFASTFSSINKKLETSPLSMLVPQQQQSHSSSTHNIVSSTTLCVYFWKSASMYFFCLEFQQVIRFQIYCKMQLTQIL